MSYISKINGVEVMSAFKIISQRHPEFILEVVEPQGSPSNAEFEVTYAGEQATLQIAEGCMSIRGVKGAVLVKVLAAITQVTGVEPMNIFATLS